MVRQKPRLEVGVRLYSVNSGQCNVLTKIAAQSLCVSMRGTELFFFSCIMCIHVFFLVSDSWVACAFRRVNLPGTQYMSKLLQTRQLVSPVGVISSEAHPFVTHSTVCPSPLSLTPGPTTSHPPRTPGFGSVFALTLRLLRLAAPIETELDKSKEGERGGWTGWGGGTHT